MKNCCSKRGFDVSFFLGGEGVKALYILKFTIGSNKKMIHLIIDFKYVLLTEVLVGLCPQTSRVRLGTGNPCPIFCLNEGSKREFKWANVLMGEQFAVTVIACVCVCVFTGAP